jgi:hypothetical protein
MTHYHCLLLLIHKNAKTRKKTTQKKWKKWRELTFKLPLYLLFFTLTSTFLFQMISPSCHFCSLTSRSYSTLPLLPSHFKLSQALTMEWAQNEVR